MTALENLKQYFGYDAFRDGQEKLINDILAGKDVLGIMPTGAGKSMCFQIPALIMSGITLVISPLISLMKDQVNSLVQSGIAAAYINSSLTERQIDKALYNAENKAYKLIYVAPERLLTPNFLSFAQSAQISMLTVDEAHCISQWGQDFRPSYAKIPEFFTQLRGRPVVSAFTATATPAVRTDIIGLLGLRNPDVLVTGFDRQNLYFEVHKPKDKFAALLSFLQDKKDRSGIIYCATRKAVEEVCAGLNSVGYNASRYHAGLSDVERHNNQDDFLYDRVRIMVATNAFGMGIDKSNVSFVVHYNMPKDIESYYQEAGRAGRDGEPADCILLYSGQDVRINSWLIENDSELEYPNKEIEEQIKERARKRLRDMTFYCATKDCLRGYILKYFGEHPPKNCRNCGSCKPAKIEIETELNKMYKKLAKEEKSIVEKPVDKKLLASLKEVRQIIAKEYNVPPFVIFHDSTLIDMCVRIPKTDEELLRVSGVGKIKSEKYGERFLKAISKFLSADTADSENNINMIESHEQTTKEYDASVVEINEEPVTVSVIADRINCILRESRHNKKLTGQKINDWLVSEGYMMIIEESGKNFKVPAETGTELGITNENREIRGENSRINMFNMEVQKYIAVNALEILDFIKNQRG